jgi:3-methyladenine DNA glycosylase AlkD
MTIPAWKQAVRDLRRMANPVQAKNLQRFFKTGPGEYGEGDRFLGLKVPQTRTVARKHAALTLRDMDRLIRSSWHEERQLALFILARKAEKASSDAERRACYDFFVRHMSWINNWDLVDVTVGRVVGAYLWDHPRTVLFRWAKSKRLWDRRVAVIATSYFIWKGRFGETLSLARMSLRDPEDLMHKAVGWMLREVGKRDVKVLRRFLDAHASRMPRTMLRYSLEKLSPKIRVFYMNR